MSEKKTEVKNKKKTIKIILISILALMLITGILICGYKFRKDICMSDEILIELNSNFYKIETDMKWLTMMNDGGSNTNEIYYVDFETNVISRVWESYKADLLYGKPETSQNILYEKELTPDMTRELKELIKKVLEKEDINEPENYNPFIISTEDEEKIIYNQDTIKEIKAILRKIDEM